MTTMKKQEKTVTDFGNDLEMGVNHGELAALFGLVAQAQHMSIHHVQEYHLLHSKRDRLLIYIFLIILYIGMNVALLGGNFKSQDVIEEEYYVVFHMVAFWGMFLFTIIEALILLATDFVSWDNWAQCALVLFNVLITFATALLFSFKPEIYEVPAHYMEYTAQVLISAVGIIFLNNYFRGTASATASLVYEWRNFEYAVLVVLLMFSLFQFSIYTGHPKVSMASERAAHFCEFVNEILNAMFALLYALLSYTEIRDKLNQHCSQFEAVVANKEFHTTNQLPPKHKEEPSDCEICM